jgi:hypothetical protein
LSVTVPSTDVGHYNLQNAITAIASQITNTASNGALVEKLTRDKANLQFQLVSSLIGAGRLSCNSILANETYLTAAQVSDGT